MLAQNQSTHKVLHNTKSSMAYDLHLVVKCIVNITLNPHQKKARFCTLALMLCKTWSIECQC
jgi:hypothetical protein